MLLMVTKLRFQTVVAGPGMGVAFGLPISTAIARMEATAQALRESAEKVPSSSESAGEKLKAAVKRKLPSRFTATTTPPRAEESESFAEKLKEAVKRKASNSPQRHKERAAKDAQRY